MAIVIFWFSLSLLFYCYAGYGTLLFLFNRVKSFLSISKISVKDAELAPATLVVAMYNEAAVLEQKIQNTLDIEYPREYLQVIFVDDGSTDGSSSIVAKYPFIKLIQHKIRMGKAAAIKTAMLQVQTPVVIFSDANSMLNNQCILRIMQHYKNSSVGGVAGEKRVTATSDKYAIGDAEGIYWKYESFLKKQEAEFYTTVGAAGELYSIRTSLFLMNEDNVITDDFLISMRVCLQGYRMEYESEAYSIEAPSASIQDEAKRKIRIAAGTCQSFSYLKEALNFFKFPLLTFQYFSHRILRWIFCPFLIPLLLISNFFIIWDHGNNCYEYFLYMQLLFYLLAMVGWLLMYQGRKAVIFNYPFYFVFMNVCIIKGLFVFFNRKHTALWKKSMRTETSGISK